MPHNSARSAETEPMVTDTETAAATEADPNPSWIRRAWDVVDERMGISALAYPVPEHANRFAWTLGGITAISFFLLIVTGIILAQFYAPIPEVANQFNPVDRTGCVGWQSDPRHPLLGVSGDVRGPRTAHGSRLPHWLL